MTRTWCLGTCVSRQGPGTGRCRIKDPWHFRESQLRLPTGNVTEGNKRKSLAKGSRWDVCHCLFQVSFSTRCSSTSHLSLQTAWASERKVEEVAPAAENYTAQPPSSKVWCPGEEVGPQTDRCPLKSFRLLPQSRKRRDQNLSHNGY